MSIPKVGVYAMHHIDWARAGQVTTLAIIAALFVVLIARAIAGEIAATLDAVGDCCEW